MKFTKMVKNDIPVTYRKIKGYVEYRLLTEFLPFWNWRRYAYWGWHPIWIFKADPLSVRDWNAPEHVYLAKELDEEPQTYGALRKLVETIDKRELQKFYDATSK